MRSADTITAIATPPGRGGIGIVRVSGPQATQVAQVMLGRVPVPRSAQHALFRDPNGVVIDAGIALYFPAPHSFTGEDVLELQGHGGPVVLDMVLAAALGCGARLARPGEFSERAFLNGKLDLAQAEAIADLIDSASTEAARAATRSLQGEFSRHVAALAEQLIELRTYIEAAIDFADEDIDFLSEGHIAERLSGLLAALSKTLYGATQGVLLRDGYTIVIAGPPNAGKSSLLNRLTGTDTAIVTAIPGTTRDVLRAQIQIDGLPLHVVDTAGLRDTSDVVEQIGVQRAREEIRRAHCVLLVIDDTQALAPQTEPLRATLPIDLPMTLVRNKIDLSGREPGLVRGDHGPEIALSVHTGSGLDALRAHLKERAGFHPAGEGQFLARRRHVDALQRARTHIAAAFAQLQGQRAAELIAEDLRQAHHALGEITGTFTTEDLLGRIFATFCIGK